MASHADWFLGSKVATPSGGAQLLHHQTWEGNDFATFDRLAMVKKYGRDPEAINAVGIWFTDSPRLTKYGAKNIDVYLSISAPITYSDEPDAVAWDQLANDIAVYGGASRFRDYLKSESVDGITLATTDLDGEIQTIWIALEPEQIRIVAELELDHRGAGKLNTPDQEKKHADVRVAIYDALGDIHLRNEALEADSVRSQITKPLSAYAKARVSPPYEELINALRAITDRGSFDDDGDFMINRSDDEVHSDAVIAELAVARQLISQFDAYRASGASDKQSTVANIVVSVEGSYVTVVSDVQVNVTLVDYNQTDSTADDIRDVPGVEGTTTEAIVRSLSAVVRPERVDEIQQLANEVPSVGPRP